MAAAAKQAKEQMYNRYENLSDEELIALSRSGDLAATDFVMEKYKSLVRRKTANLYLQDGGDREDLIQEGMLGLFKAVRDYDEGKKASFAAFADLCITRQLYTAIEAAGRKKHQPLNEAVSYDAVIGEREQRTARGTEAGERECENYLELMASDSADPENQYIQAESGRELEEDIQEALSPMERRVLELHLADLDYIKIAEELGKDPKSADNALQRIKAKVRQIMARKQADLLKK